MAHDPVEAVEKMRLKVIQKLLDKRQKIDIQLEKLGYKKAAL